MRITALTKFTCLARLNGTSRIFVILAMMLLAQACTNSKLIISPLYNRLDDRIREDFNEMGDFNEEQTAAFEASLGTFHVWHRQSELPQYAELLSSISQSISSADTDRQDIEQWFDAVERGSMLVRECHPINFSFDLMQSLSDEQLNSIENHFEEERQESRERYANRTPEERIDRRIRNINKWANRIDMDITATQRAMLLSTLKRQTSLRKEYYALTEEWNRKFFLLLRDRDNPDFKRNMGVHMKSLWKILEDAYPLQWQANRDLWKQTALRFADSMTEEQRVTLSSWMAKMGTTLVAISEDEPSFKVTADPSLGCLVDPEKS